MIASGYALKWKFNMGNAAEENMAFSPAEFEPKPSNWFSANLKYEGTGSAEFRSPAGSITGPFVANYSERGDQLVEGTCEQISCDPDYDGPPIAFLFGAKTEVEGKRKSWGIGGFDNPCSGLTITTPDGAFTATRVQIAGMNTQLIVAKPEDAKPIRLRFHVLQGKFETGNPNEPKFFVLPLINCIAQPSNRLPGDHPLRIYPTPRVPESLTGRELLIAQLMANKQNSVIPFFLQGRLCFIEPLADYEQREASLKAGAQRVVTAVLIGELAGEAVGQLEEFQSWFPLEVLSALGFASGVEVSPAWIEIRDEHGMLIRRLHGRPWLPIFDEGDVLLTKFDAGENSGIGSFLTQYLACASEKRSYLEAAMNHSRMGSLGTGLRLYDNLDHLIRALECLCREHGVTRQELLSQLTPTAQGQVKGILSNVRTALQPLIQNARGAGDLSQARVLAKIQSRAVNVATTEKDFGLAVVSLLDKFGLPDASIIDVFFAANPRPDGLQDWASVLSSYRGATIHEGYMNFEKRHDARDVVRFCAHLKDVLARMILKEVGYSGTYERVTARGYGPQPIDWVQPNTEPARLGFS